MSFLRNVRGMSLVEIMIVIVIMGSIAAVIGTNVMSQFERSRVRTTELQIQNNLRTALEYYYLDNGVYPTTAQGLEALVRKPTTGPEPVNYNPGGYLGGKTVPKDAWNRDFIYESDGTSYTITSLGRDGREGGDGFDEDIVYRSNE